jgi:hypothetical protein
MNKACSCAHQVVVMKWLFRPSNLVLVSVALALSAGVLLVWPSNRDLARRVPAGDQEIVWLNPATNAVSWERFVAAVHQLRTERPDLGLEVAPEANPFPSQTTEVPELALAVRGRKGRLWFRWYKLTGDLGPGQWVEALARRGTPPVAIIGGGSSDRARGLAKELNEQQGRFAPPPLLLITMASLEQNLMQIYAGRTFRFCFTNRQMAQAVTDFLWTQDDLRPDARPVYLAQWQDDPYSEDLCEEFHKILGPDGAFGKLLEGTQLAKAATRAWSGAAGWSLLGGVFPGLDLERLRAADLRQGPFWSSKIPYSVGSFSRPNHWEEDAAGLLVDELAQHPAQERPLLVLPAAPQPARRFLRALVRTAPLEDRRFVVASGDAIDFNTVYRDRNLAWSIQDLPVSLVFFCQRNPVDPAAFRPDSRGAETTPPDPAGQTSTGTQDLLLYRDIVETLVEAAYSGESLLPSADDLRNSLREAQSKDGRRRFTRNGNLHSGSGEFVVCLRPVRQADRVLPQARLQVWNRLTDPEGNRHWVPVPVAGQFELKVDYASGTGD